MSYMKKVHATVIEKEMQKARKEKNFIGEVEESVVEEVVENAKRNSRFGDKVIMSIKPLYVHIPDWQRDCDKVSAQEIGNHYDSKKWEMPKLLHFEGKLICVDGMHRIYGAFTANIPSVVCELLECTITEARNLFLAQTNDRRKMLPTDYYRAAVANGEEKYIKLKEVCNSHNVAVKGDSIENQIGIFTSITDGVRSIEKNGTGLLDRIINLITELEWNGYADTYNGKAYTAKFIRAMHKMYAYYDGRIEEMETILKKKCRGTEFFVENIMDCTQAQIFDYLSEVVRYEMENPFTNKKGTKKVQKKAI